MISVKNFSEKSVLFARLSNLAYLTPKEAKKVFDKMGYTSTYYQSKGSNVYVLEDANDVIVVCRGTEVKEWNDIKADLSIDLVPSRTGVGQVHRGFRNYVDSIWEPVKNHVLDCSQKKLWLTGHSLGAGMATLMARRFILDPVNHTVEALFTYGSPRVGDRTYINTFNDKVIHHRWVNDGDIVTKVPFSPWYFHCGIMHHIDGKGKVTVNYDRKINWVKIASLLLPHGVLKLIIHDIKYHSSETYVKQLSFWSMNDTGNI